MLRGPRAGVPSMGRARAHPEGWSATASVPNGTASAGWLLPYSQYPAGKSAGEFVTGRPSCRPPRVLWWDGALPGSARRFHRRRRCFLRRLRGLDGVRWDANGVELAGPAVRWKDLECSERVPVDACRKSRRVAFDIVRTRHSYVTRRWRSTSMLLSRTSWKRHRARGC